MRTPRFLHALRRLRAVRDFAACSALLVVLALLPSLGAAVADGALSGSVSNAGTGDLLEGVRVSLPKLGLTVLTDNTGRYTFSSVPPGAHEIVATYTGLDALRHTVSVGPGQRVARDFELTAGIYKLETFTVAGEPWL